MLKNRIKELRKEKELTQGELARIIHLTRSSIAGYESGSKIPTIDTIIDLSNYFNVTTDYLLGVSNLRHYNSPSELNQNFIKQFENNYNKLDDSYKLAVSKIVTTLINSLEHLELANITNKNLTKNLLDRNPVSHKAPVLYSDDPDIMKELESYRNELLNEKKNISSKSTKSKHSG
jgi:transcriptional regulator with XRE-family HTH domain